MPGRLRDLPIVVVWLLLLIVIVVALWTGILIETLQALGEGLAAVISGAFLLLAAILTHALNVSREQQLNHEREMQKNYASVLGQIGDLIRGGASSDAFSVVHLQSWVWGSPAVIRATQVLLDVSKSPDVETKRAALERLVREMRNDAGLPEAPDDLRLANVYSKQEHHL